MKALAEAETMQQQLQQSGQTKQSEQRPKFLDLKALDSIFCNVQLIVQVHNKYFEALKQSWDKQEEESFFPQLKELVRPTALIGKRLRTGFR